MISSIRKITKELWWAAVTTGLVSIVFGLAAMLWPRSVLNIFIYLFSIIVLVVSVVVLGQTLVNLKSNRLWWLSMLFAICGISVGLYIMINPKVASDIIAILLSVYIFSQSLLDLVMASYSDDNKAKTPVVISGIAGVIFGFIVILMPSLATEALVWVVGLYILAHGLFIEYYSFKTRRQVKELSKRIKDAFDDNDIKEAEIVDKPKAKKTAKKAKASKR
ncbi:MAG: DUF308 domain-containing protein [Candidatus Saccharibacteria bacterium]|nr:DUF308 domain-containing protein [Candidatus Saccharibacteria bacterium]